MSAPNTIRDTFFEECDELLEALTDGLSELEDGTATDDTVHAIFRAVHSIKGGAGAFSMDAIVAFAHAFETVLDLLREGKIVLDSGLLAVLQHSSDHLNNLVEDGRSGTNRADSGTTSILASLETYLGDTVKAGIDDQSDDFGFEAITFSLDEPIVTEEPGRTTFEIEFTPTADLLKNGHEPELLLDALADLGTVSVRVETASVPDLRKLDWQNLYLSWHLALETTADEDQIREVFEFVEDLCDLDIAELTKESAVFDIPTDADADLETDDTDTLPVQETKPRAAAPAKKTLRVDLDRVDRLVNVVGELIINQARISQLIDEAEISSSSGLPSELEAYQNLAREIQEGVMSIRAQPIKPLFQRMSRVVRETMMASNKKVRLLTDGEGTEIDKTVIERIADPLTHMIRNAVDHGIEPSEKRVAAGKDATGNIRLTATHRSGHVIISISDDGAGLNRAKILETAMSKGLVPQDAELSNSEIDNLLFLPGFSTAVEVSDLSGRGVGMDVVKNAITSLGGRMSITSAPGKGSTFSIVLPLTLAVLDGMIVQVADQTMVIPISSVLETIRPTVRDLDAIGTKNWMLRIRGLNVPIFDVATQLGLRAQPIDYKDQVLLLVEAEGLGQFALAVDDLSDQRQVVIKGLDGNYGAIPGISAATILGDGKIALILDPDTLTMSAKPGVHSPHMTTPKGEALHAASA
ncbi:chemotaxis protein CheA [Litoreibacter roseus]|uniref:Chemotaxis protein CheA n=1 Tax=Litoreibacter roseus TaxID=2601869 RepID=A0A6N6JHW7_9RHOB|nr:chemotaxis protein CheA [Litoreibacter roseus]GFE64812.1 chemotaxis protein CheA [Litoreibacter roseus]